MPGYGIILGIRRTQGTIQIDRTEGAISRLLLRHMLPRYRALLRGMVTAEAEKEKQAPPVKKKAA